MTSDPAADRTEPGPRPGGPGLAVVVLSDAFERVHHALCLAAAAAAIGRPVRLFFSLGATQALVAPCGQGGCDAGGGMGGGAAMPGWAALRPRAPFPDALAEDAALRARGLGGMEEMLAACAALGVGFLVCEAGLRARDRTPADLRADLPLREGGAVTFLADIPPGAVTLTI